MSLYFDKYGYPVEKSMDGGDSAVKIGILNMCDSSHVAHDLILDFVHNGRGVRHPRQKPWNNSFNFTKDQLKCLVAGLYASGFHSICEEILRAHEDRWFFCQNTERDFVGTTKHFYPHKVRDFEKRYVARDPDLVASLQDNAARAGADTLHIDSEWFVTFRPYEWRMFDGADPLLPNDILFLELAAKRKTFHCEKLGRWFHLKALENHFKSTNLEQNQMIAECFVFDDLRYFLVDSLWEMKDFRYWSIERGEEEYHEMQKALIKG